MAYDIPTIKIVSADAPGGHVIINEKDRQPHHEIWTGNKPADANPADDKSAAFTSGKDQPDAPKPTESVKPADDQTHGKKNR
jgi:hypothetical protein